MISIVEAAAFSKSSHLQDLYILETFSEKLPQKGFFVDVGASDGVKSSNTYLFEKYLHWDGISFEPNPKSFFLFQETRKTPVYPQAVAKKEEKVPFFCCKIPSHSGIIGDFHSSHASEERYKNCEGDEIDVETVPMQKVLDALSIFRIDFLDVDTEGSELEVLQTVDFDRVQVKIINVQNLFNKEKIRKFLKMLGFHLQYAFKNDDLFVHHSFKN